MGELERLRNRVWALQWRAERLGIAKGGPGSGHFGHVGRLGQQGGSLPGRGSRMGPSEIPYVGYIGLSADWYDGYEGMKRPPIREAGMRPGEKSQFTAASNRRDSIYLATTIERATVYANLYARPIILRVDTRKLDPALFYHDPLDFPLPDGRIGQFAYRGQIPSDAIIVEQRGIR